MTSLGPTGDQTRENGSFENSRKEEPPLMESSLSYSLPPLPVYSKGPRRLRNKTKAERSGPRKRRRKKKQSKETGAVAQTTTSKRTSRKADGNKEVFHQDTSRLSFHKEQNPTDVDNTQQMKQTTAHYPRKQRNRTSIYEAFFPPRRSTTNSHPVRSGESNDNIYHHVFDASSFPTSSVQTSHSRIVYYQNSTGQSSFPEHNPFGPFEGTAMSPPPSPPRSASWWARTNQNLVAENRHFWTSYVTAAAEVERQRRIDEQLAEEQNERRERQEWARRAIEAEQARILEEYKLNQRVDTIEATSAGYTDDYIVVCPNSARGCTYEGKLNDIGRHLLHCEFVGENMGVGATEKSINFQGEEYVIMCPYAYFGCDHCCTKEKLEDHIQICAFRGKTREDEAKERRESIICAIAATEEEQQRRVVEAQKRHEHSIDDGRAGSTPLQKVMELQTEILQQRIGEELIEFSVQCREAMNLRRNYCKKVIHNLSLLLEKINFKVFIIPYGSYATGFSLPESDLDLVLASRSNFGDGEKDKEIFESNLKEVLLNLSTELKNAPWASNVQYIPTAIVPVLKFVALIPRAQQSSECNEEKYFSIPVDITVQNFQHAGIATVEFVKTVAKCIPQIVPVTILLKKCLKQKGLLDPFSGGLPAYGLFLLVTSIVLQHVEIFDIEGFLEENQDDSSFTCTSPPPCDKFTEEQKSYGKETAISVCKSVMYAQSQQVSTSPRGKSRLRARSISRGTEGEFGEEDKNRDIIRLGRLFMHVLHFIGRTFDPEIDNVSIRYGSLGAAGNLDPIMLDDPLSPGNNVGRRCYKISEIQKLCGDALTRLYSILVRSKGHHSVGNKSTSSVLAKVFPGSTFKSTI